MKGAATLSERETQIVKQIAEGKTKKEIAIDLKLSVRTIENHTRNAFKKTGCRKSTELVSIYLQSQRV